jgi:hypothetical protein
LRRGLDGRCGAEVHLLQFIAIRRPAGGRETEEELEKRKSEEGLKMACRQTSGKATTGIASIALVLAATLASSAYAGPPGGPKLNGSIEMFNLCTLEYTAEGHVLRVDTSITDTSGDGDASAELGAKTIEFMQRNARGRLVPMGELMVDPAGSVNPVDFNLCSELDPQARSLYAKVTIECNNCRKQEFVGKCDDDTTYDDGVDESNIDIIGWNVLSACPTLSD